MNLDNLHELINRYENNLNLIYGSEHFELFKWRAMKVWQDEWGKPEGAFPSFIDRFNAAKKEFSLFIDNSRMHPSTGIVKLWEKDHTKIEELFCNILLAPAKGNTSLVQNNMDTFLDEYENMRQRYFPANWSYKQDRHSASVFLALNEPEFNFVFKSSEALTMAKYIEFGLPIGSGASFSLENYYRLCGEIVSALRQHKTLLEKHFARLTDSFYYDESLHLLAFDLMYCSRTYNFYRGLIVPSTGEVRRKGGSKQQINERAIQEENKRRVELLQQEETELLNKIDVIKDISLIGMRVTSDKYGVGTVVAQDINKISVSFESIHKSFILDRKFSARPRFEDDAAVVDAFTEYTQAQERLQRIRNELARLL